jgi:type VI secretion system secreted protein VgrG
MNGAFYRHPLFGTLQLSPGAKSRKPVFGGTLPARVTSTTADDIYAHIDKDGRYRVNLDFDRETWKPGYESL